MFTIDHRLNAMIPEAMCALDERHRRRQVARPMARRGVRGGERPGQRAALPLRVYAA